MTFDIEGYFPFEQIRSQQSRAIEFALDAFMNKGKRFVILEMGPGCGKSATAVTIARYMQAHFELGQISLGGTYFLTTQKVLQKQYMRDFGAPHGNMHTIKSASSITCQFHENDMTGISCAEIRRLIGSKAQCKMVYKLCEDNCKYDAAKRRFFDAPEGITNYAFFLALSAYTYDMQRRGLLVLDEAHNVADLVGNFVTIGFSNLFYKDVLGVKPPNVNAGQERIYRWLMHTVRPALQRIIKKEANNLNKGLDENAAIKAVKHLERLKHSFQKIEQFVDVYDPTTWVLDSSKTDRRGERVYQFKPTDVGRYCENILYAQADKVLLMSATILNKNLFCESLGIRPSEAEFLRIPSPFDVVKRPIHYMPVGSMSRAKINDTLPSMIQAIKVIMDEHPTEKGIIHCVNFHIADEIVKTLGGKRLLAHTSDDREEIIKFHITSKQPTVLVSPSMTEGVDLVDDLSRFQIVCKVPYPYLGDASVRRKMKRNSRWYAYQTVKTVIQGLGRSIRNDNDHAISYILDSDWGQFFVQNSDMFPDEFTQSLQY